MKNIESKIFKDIKNYVDYFEDINLRILDKYLEDYIIQHNKKLNLTLIIKFLKIHYENKKIIEFIQIIKKYS